VDFKIVWTLRSRQDLRELATFIARDNPSAALKLGDLIFGRVDSLQNFPELGRVVPERNQSNLREIIVKNYRVIYRIRQHSRAPQNKKRPAVSRRARVIKSKTQQPTLASSSLFSTFTILNCSACMPVSARKDSLPKYRFSISMRCFSSSVRRRSSTVGWSTMRS
jgi:toxin ParE1/3/4